MISTASSSGLLVLGMHRSGTSALTRVLNLCGADIGARILQEGVGNETGHWEDAIAVELHERLFASFGASWDEALGLPADWSSGEAAAAARETIRDYLEANRSQHRLWVAKDPRLSLFAPLWIEGAASVGQPLGAVLMLRHPLEVSTSLMARDGIALGRGLLLWLDYTLAAVQAVMDLPYTLITYDYLLEDWRACIERIRDLPGGHHLKVNDVTVHLVNEFLDSSQRHHKYVDVARLPEIISEVWSELSSFALEGRIPVRVVNRLAKKVNSIRELLHPLLAEQRLTKRRLWERINRAEVDFPAVISGCGRNAEAAAKNIENQHAELTSLAAVLVEQHGQVIHAISEDIRHMQGMVTASLERAASNEGKAAIAEQLAGPMDLLSAGQENLEVAISPLTTLAETLPVSLSGVHARIELLATEQKEAFAGLGNVDGMVAELMQATRSAEAAETRTGDMHKLLERELGRITGTPGMQDRLESAIAEHTRMQIDAQTLAARIEKLQTVLTESHDAIQVLAGELDQNRRGREEAQRQLEERGQELAVLRHVAARLRETSAQHETMINSLSWRLTRPLRFARRVLSGRSDPSDNDRLRSVWRKALLRLPVGTRFRSRMIGRTLVNEGGTIAALPDHHVAAVVELAPVTAGLPDVFVWSVIDFHFRVQRPQHLARALAAKGHRVFYISVNFCDSDEAGFHFAPLDGCGRLYQIHLYLAGEPLIYSQMPVPEQVTALHASLAKLLAWTRTSSSISLVQHPYWSALVRSVPNARVVYDCMDHHAGFDNNSPAVLEAEHKLVEESELVVVTSAWLEQEVKGAARTAAVIRNAGEFEFFKDPPAEVFRDERGRRVIGYYGAIASWFDFDLVRRVAEAHPEALVVLVGHDSVGAAAALTELGNILLVGEVAYTRLPYWLHAFDVCLLPFKVIPLTLATNPVKVYEYLAAGKSIVAVDLPEMAQFDGLIRTAADSDVFVAAVSDALATPASAELVASRQAFASRQTWAHRAAELDAVLNDLQEPRISVVVLTYNNLAFTQACLHSVEAHSDYRNLEVIVVDNASGDGSVNFLRGWATESSAAGHARRLILNRDNLGFAAGNNVGLAAATGDVLVMLNNDTFVTPGWVRTLHSHLKRDAQLGLVGPVTNNIGNEARIEICYANMDQMVEQAGLYTRRHPGQIIPIQTVAFFCAMLPRAVYDSLGGLDEAFGLGFFEDDDYCKRAQQAGWKIGSAEDVFVHHHLSASFNLVGAERKKELFERNKIIYEAKWGEWKPHVYRPTTDVK